MSWTASTNSAITSRHAVVVTAVGVLSFHLAYGFRGCSFLIVVYLYALAALARQRTSRRAFYFGLGAGLLAYGPQLSCFYTIFGPAAIALWLVLAFWIGLFGLLSRLCLLQFGPRWALALIPLVWTGLEYFRSEVYYLRFSWLNAGYAFSDGVHAAPLGVLGVYGLGFLLMWVAVVLNLFPRLVAGSGKDFAVSSEARGPDRKRFVVPRGTFAGLLALGGFGIWTNMPPTPRSPERMAGVEVAGVQMEFPGDLQLLAALDTLKKQHPGAQLLVLSEYTFTEPLPERVKLWCRKNQRYLIVGGKDFVNATTFFDTAFVIDPRGEIVFRQAKSVPIQFFNDGLPAREQKLWDSPWGKIGICICYDLSYTRVTDQLVRLGAQALIVPTMDLVEWGRHQHELHARVAPIRAAESGLPIFRVASSGISQLVDARGRVTATAPFPGEEAPISGWLEMSNGGRIPFDRLLGSFAWWLTAGLAVWLVLDTLKKRIFR